MRWTENRLNLLIALDVSQLASTINDILTAMNTETSDPLNRYLAMLSSMAHLAGFCSVFVELNGIEALVSLNSQFTKENPNKTFLELIWAYHCSEAASPLLTSPISNDLVELLKTSETETAELVLKCLINLGVDKVDLIRSQLGPTLLPSLSLLLQTTLPVHHQHLSIRDNIAFFGESSQDKSTKLCLNLLILVVEGSQQFRLDNEFVRLIVPLLRHNSTNIVLLVLRVLHTITSNPDISGTMRQQIPAAQIDGSTRSVPMMTLVAELFDNYLSRLRTQIGQIQLLWTNESESAMLLDSNTGATNASESVDVLTLTPRISATCDVMSGLSNLFSSAVYWEDQLHEMVLGCGMLRLFGDCFSFFLESLEFEDSLTRANPAVELSWMDSRTSVKEDAIRVVRSCVVGIVEVIELSHDRSDLIFRSIHPQQQKPHKTFFSVLSTLLSTGVPDLTQPVARIVKQILTWRDGYLPKILKSGLVEVLFRYVITQDIDDELTERQLMQIANRVLAGGNQSYLQHYQPRMIERVSAHRFHSLLAQFHFVEMMANRSQMRTKEWSNDLKELQYLSSEIEALMNRSQRTGS
ncbi:hypothetical protein BLNAU_13959 [Blattamonas nauphoetae]|uniref:FPL domain-containing protein n=1 Tax=Blattamonas nauphoetae TaxID=2049346 RepID=A0ABQ9XLJ0_9EUKA|nr:hypothetical protein BLNAU_13959 [Blattamonas nauphoetae]